MGLTLSPAEELASEARIEGARCAELIADGETIEYCEKLIAEQAVRLADYYELPANDFIVAARAEMNRRIFS